MRSARFAFIGWNPFQIRLAYEIARELPGSVLIIEGKPPHLPRFSKSWLDSLSVPYRIVPRSKMASIDGEYEVLVAQTVFSGIESIRRSKIAWIQYGLAKDPHNYGPWRAYGDLALVYGPYSAKKMARYCPVREVGNTRFDAYKPPPKPLKHGTRKTRTILYAPTWGALSTQDEFLDAVLALAPGHRVLLKLHHNTAIKERARRERLQAAGVQFYGEHDDLFPLLAEADLVLTDFSGAIFDALLAEKKVLLLQNRELARYGRKLSPRSLELAARDRIGPIVSSPDELAEAVSAVFTGKLDLRIANEALRNELFVRGGSSIARACSALISLAEGEIEPPSASQRGLRAALQFGRGLLYKGALLPYFRLEERLNPPRLS